MNNTNTIPANLVEAVSMIEGATISNGNCEWNYIITFSDGMEIMFHNAAWNKPKHYGVSLIYPKNIKGEIQYTNNEYKTANILRNTPAKKLANAIKKYKTEWNVIYRDCLTMLKNSNDYYNASNNTKEQLLATGKVSGTAHNDNLYLKTNNMGCYATISVSRESVRLDLSSVPVDIALKILALL